MQCDLDISKVKNNSFLYRDEKGKIISVTKEEILKEANNEIEKLKIENEQLKSLVQDLKEKFDLQSKKQKEFLKVLGGK